MGDICRVQTVLSGVIREKPWALILAWLVIVALASPLAARIGDVVKTETGSFLPSTAESVRAEEALEKLGATTAPGYIIVVSGVNVSYDTYSRLREGYHEAERLSGVDFYSWIDVVDEARASLNESLGQALNAAVSLVNATYTLGSSYNRTLAALENTTGLIVKLDEAYVGAWRLLSAAPNLTRLVVGASEACNRSLPAYAATYYNVVRVEALLEHTDAYREGLSNDTVAAVLAGLARLDDRGIPTPSPEFVAGVYKIVSGLGGPQAFNNSVAARVTSTLLSNVMPANVLSALESAWTSVVANYTDFRIVVEDRGNTTLGQLALLSTIFNEVVPRVKPSAAAALTAALAPSLPEEALGIASAAAGRAACNPDRAPRVLADVLASTLDPEGASGGLALEVALKAVEGNATTADAARLVAAIAAAKAPQDKRALVLEAASVLASMDPEARGLLADPGNASVAAAYMLAAAMNATVDVDELRAYAGNAAGLAYILLKSTLASRDPRAVELLDALWSSGALGRSLDAETVKEVVARLLAQRSGGRLDESTAMLIASKALEVYQGSEDASHALAELVDYLTKVKVIPKVLDEMKGLLVEKDYGGFIVALANATEVEDALKAKAEIVELLRDNGYAATVFLDGDSYMRHEIREAALSDIERSDRMSMILVFIILALLMESLAAVALPFVGIGFGLAAALAAAYVLASKGVIDVTTHSRTIMFTTGLGLGIDYAAYVARSFREELASGSGPREAAARAFERSWRPVLAGATTAAIGFGSMMLAKGFPFVYSIGTNVPLSILLVMTASLTFIPALLAYVGGSRWFWWPSKPGAGGERGRGLGRVAASRPAVLLAVGLVVIAASAVVYSGFHGSYDITLNLPRGSESLKAISIVNREYDPGALYPVYVVASDADAARSIAERVSSLDCVARAWVDNTTGRVVNVVLSVYPLDVEGMECASRIRSVAHQVDPASLVGGIPSVNLDLRDYIKSVFYGRVYPVAVTLMIATILAAYGSLVIALAAVGGILAASLTGTAAAVAVYQSVLGEKVIWFLPIITLTAILGVGMDYNSFFIARAREECMRECSRGALARAVSAGSPLVLGLATIMAGAYIGLAVAKSPALSQMGVALTLGVLFAGLYAALLITPPLIALLGRAAWWPRAPRREGGQ